MTPQACTDADPADVRVKRLMLSRATTKVLLVDGSKFGRSTTFTVTAPADLDVLVTDAGTSPEVLAPFRELGLTVLRADSVQ